MKAMKNVKESANFIWSIADLLRGDYKQSDYGKSNSSFHSPEKIGLRA
jgi:hypothetical protein